MVGIYKYECGLKFTGMIASNKEKAEKFLAEKNGYYAERYVGDDENGKPQYEKYFQPFYNIEAFEILELTTIE